MKTLIPAKGQEIERLKIALEDKNRFTKELRAEAYHAPDEVELPPIVLQRGNEEYSRFTASPLEEIERDESILKGRIVTVNREHNFVVIDLGRQNDMGEGAGFGVYRDGKEIGSIESIQVRERIAACDIKDVKKGFYIEIDDIVIGH